VCFIALLLAMNNLIHCKKLAYLVMLMLVLGGELENTQNLTCRHRQRGKRAAHCCDFVCILTRSEARLGNESNQGKTFFL